MEIEKIFQTKLAEYVTHYLERSMSIPKDNAKKELSPKKAECIAKQKNAHSIASKEYRELKKTNPTTQYKEVYSKIYKQLYGNPSSIVPEKSVEIPAGEKLAE